MKNYLVLITFFLVSQLFSNGILTFRYCIKGLVIKYAIKKVVFKMFVISLFLLFK